MKFNHNLLQEAPLAKKLFYWLVIGLFFCAFGLVWLDGIRTNRMDLPYSLIIGAIAFFGFVLLWAKASPFIEHLSKKKFALLMAAPLLAGFVMAFVAALTLRQDLENYPLDIIDCNIVARDLAMGNDRPVERNWYFVIYNTNTLCMVFMYYVYRLSVLLTGVVHPTSVYMLNAIFLCLSLCFIAGIGYLLRGKAGAFFSSLLSLCFLPFFLMLCLPYTDAFALPFSTGGVLLYLLAYKSPPGKKRLLFLAGSFLVLSVGFHMKGNVLILLVAICLHWVLCVKDEKLWVRLVAVAMAPVFLLGFTQLFRFYLQSTLIVDYTDYDTLHLPWNHWVMMGLTGIGGYNGDSYTFSYQFATVAEKKAAINGVILEKIDLYLHDFSAFFYWFTNKTHLLWGDGGYDTVHLLTATPEREKYLQWPVLQATDHWMRGFHLLYYFNLFAYGAGAVMKKKIEPFAWLVFLSLTGMFAFLCLWEANARYAYVLSFLPLLGFVWTLPQWAALLGRYFSQNKDRQATGQT